MEKSFVHSGVEFISMMNVPEDCKIKFSQHAIQRMFEQSISKNMVISAIHNAEILKDYPKDKPYPSSLILGIIGEKPIHIVLANNLTDNEIYIVTVYYPDRKIWSNDFKTRRK